MTLKSCDKEKSNLDLIGKWKYQKKFFSYKKQITFGLTNLMGNVYFSNYVDWQGEARERLLLEHPAALEFMKVNPNIGMFTSVVHHRFIGNAYVGDSLEIRVTCKDIKKHSCILFFKYIGGEEKVMGEGWQKICFKDASTGKICQIPQVILDIVEPMLEK